MSAKLQCLHGCLISYSSWIKGLNYVIASGKLGVVTHVCSMAANGVLTSSQWQCDQRRGMSPYSQTILLHLSPATLSHPAPCLWASFQETLVVSDRFPRTTLRRDGLLLGAEFLNWGATAWKSCSSSASFPLCGDPEAGWELAWPPAICLPVLWSPVTSDHSSEAWSYLWRLENLHVRLFKVSQESI